jgi:polyisoprenoid-binding protein YceI
MMTARFQFDSSKSRLTVQAFAAGMLSFLGHSPTFAVGEFTGDIQLDPGPPPAARLNLAANAASLALMDKVSSTDRREIETRMRDEVLAVDHHAVILFESADITATPVSSDQFRLRIHGQLTLRGDTKSLDVPGDMYLHGDKLRLTGGIPLSLSAFRIAPITALGGTLRLKDEVRVAFDLLGVSVASAVPIGGADG